MSQSQDADERRRYRARLAAIMEAAEALLLVLDPLKAPEVGILWDAVVALIKEDGVRARRPGRYLIGVWARRLAAVSVAEVADRERRARSDLTHAVKIARQTAGALADVPDPLDPAYLERRRLLGWALTAVRNHATAVVQLANARTGLQDDRARIVLPAPPPPPVLAVRPWQPAAPARDPATTARSARNRLVDRADGQRSGRRRPPPSHLSAYPVLGRESMSRPRADLDNAAEAPTAGARSMSGPEDAGSSAPSRPVWHRERSPGRRRAHDIMEDRVDGRAQRDSPSVRRHRGGGRGAAR